MTDFIEVADRVWVARHEWWSLNVTVVGGERGLVVIDTHASEVAGQQVMDAARRLGAGRVVGVVNTHEHFDHTFGNAVFRDADPAVPIHAHEVAAVRTVPAGERIQARYEAHPEDEHAPEVLATRITPANRVFATSQTIELGDRVVELSHHGRGHTAGDAIVSVPDVDVCVMGDLVEESAPPAYGTDSFPLDWPTTLEAIVPTFADDAIVVPGHGAVVDPAFVRRQLRDIARVATTIRHLFSNGVPASDAPSASDWPWDPALLQRAIERGYEHLR